MKKPLLPVLDAEAFISKKAEASVRLANGARLTAFYKGWSDVTPAFVYFLDSRPVDAEAAARLLEAEAATWDD